MSVTNWCYVLEVKCIVKVDVFGGGISLGNIIHYRNQGCSIWLEEDLFSEYPGCLIFWRYQRGQDSSDMHDANVHVLNHTHHHQSNSPKKLSLGIIKADISFLACFLTESTSLVLTQALQSLELLLDTYLPILLFPFDCLLLTAFWRLCLPALFQR